MVCLINLLIFGFLLLSFSQPFLQFTSALNLSKLLPPVNFHYDLPTPSRSPPPSNFLKDVLKAISARQNWTLEEVRVLGIDVRNASVGSSQRYQFRIRVGKNELNFRVSDEVNLWRKLKRKGGFDSSIYSFSSKAVLKKFGLEGPFELRVDGDDELSLRLPFNITRTGLKRVLVGEGIKVEVQGAREVSLFHASEFGFQTNRSSDIGEDRRNFWPFSPSLCIPVPSILISGSANIVAHRTRNSDAYIKTTFLSKDMIELLPEKCYTKHTNKKGTHPIDSLTPRLALLEKLMRSFLGDRIQQTGVSSFVKAKITSSTLVRFQLELEKDVKDSDKSWLTLAEWRTKPRVQRVSFEVVARVEGRRLKPVIVKKLRPFIAAETAAWSIIMSNISFTKFPSVLVPPEALTLDVKW